VCTADQLGSPTDSVAAPDTAGAVYGTFRVVNISTSACTVGGAGTLTTLAQGAADATKISSARHVAGDAAPGLPAPSTEVTGLQLQPGAAYEVKFAWVPSATCPTTGSTGGTTDGGSTASPTPTPTADAGTSSGTSSTGTDSGVTTQMMTGDGTADGSVIVSHTTAAGSPTVSATVSNACAGTVIYTGVLAGA